MTPVDFHRQVFRDSAQWGHGLSYKLQLVEGGGVALFSRPAFEAWVTRDDEALGANALASDECGRLFWVHAESGVLYRLDPSNDLVEPVLTLAADDSPVVVVRLLAAEDRLWLLDRAHSRVIALRPDTVQIIGEISLERGIDAAVDAGRVFTLDAQGIHAFDLHGQKRWGPTRGPLSAPIAMAAGADARGVRWVYVIDEHARGFLRYRADTGAYDSQLGQFDDVHRTAPTDRLARSCHPRALAHGETRFTPRLLVVQQDGTLLVSDGSATAHEFSPDGGYVGSTGEVTPLSAMTGLAAAARGELFAGSPEGIARFNRRAGLAGHDGHFYTRTLDNGSEHDEGWHRLDLSTELAAGGALDVFYASVNDTALAAAVDSIFERDAPALDQVAALENVLGDLWRGPHELRAMTPAGAATEALDGFAQRTSHSVLFSAATGRYLWLKLALAGLAPRATAAVRELRVYHPRLSYLRYLPALYQHDPVSSEFLGRFLAMFETVSSSLERTIERIPEAFDPELAPAEFLDWLAQWLDLGVEEDWPPDVKRRLIQNASRLYQRKGPPAGLTEFIEIVTGARPVIRESFETQRPFVLGSGVALGIDSQVQRRPVADLPREQRTVLGHGSTLGSTAIRGTTQLPVNPFSAYAHRFTVLLSLPVSRYRRYARGLHRIIRENAPAHVDYDIRLVPPGLRGPTMLGVNLTLADPRPMRLGYSTLGEAICARSVYYGPQVGVDLTLTDRDGGSHRTGAIAHGEQ
jgi:phage tail-like protein